MQEKQIEKLNKLLELMQNDTVTPKVLEEFLVVVLSTIQKSKEGFESLSNYNLAKIQGALDYIQSEHEQIVSRVDAKNTSTWARFEGKLQEVTKLLAEIKQIKATPGKDADEEKIVAEVLSKIPKHECKMVECEHEEELGEDIVEKINELPTDDERLKIDAIHIKNLSELTKTYGSNISKAIYQLSDVVLTNLANNDTLKWDSTNKYWVNGTAGGSSPLTTKGDLYTFTTVDARLGVGTNYQFLQADSATATGLRWATVSNGLTPASGTFKLGGNLTENTTIDGVSTYNLSHTNIVTYTLSGTAIGITGASAVLTGIGSVTLQSPANLRIATPNVIATTATAGQVLTLVNATTGEVEYSTNGAGTVTSFSSGDLSPLFTTSVANATTTPALSFTLSNAAANTYFGNGTGSSGAPSFTTAGALTRVDDTNVTLTLGGTPGRSLLQAVSLTLGWTGTLSVSRGGTGTGTTFTEGSVIFAGASGVYSQDNTNFFWDDTNNILKLGGGTPTYTLTTATLFTATKTANTYVTANIQNLSNGTTASTDFIINNDAATDTTNFLDIGISSSLNTDPLYTIAGAGQAYIWNTSEALAIGTAGAFPLKFFTGGTLAANEFMRGTSTGIVQIGTTTVTQGRVNITALSTTAPALNLRGAASMTGEILNIENSAGTDMFQVYGSGTSFIGLTFGTSVNTPSLTQIARIRSDTNAVANIIFSNNTAGSNAASSYTLSTTASSNAKWQLNSATNTTYAGASSANLVNQNAASLGLGTNDTIHQTIDKNGNFTFAQAVITTGSPTFVTFTPAAHTTLTASAEASDIYFRLSRTVQFSTGAITTQRAFRIEAPTYGFVGASTITDAYTVAITAAPTAGTNATITRAWAFAVQAGNTQLAGSTYFGGTGVAPTAFAHLAASTTSSASLRIVTGTAPTSPNEGDYWFDSTQKAIQKYVNGIKQTDTNTLFTQTNTVTVANTVTETALTGTGLGTLTIPANFLVAGKTLRLRMWGYHSSTGNPTITIRIKLGSTTIGTMTGSSGNGSNDTFEAWADVTCRTTGGTGTVFTQGIYREVQASGLVTGTDNTTTSTIDTTASQAVSITVEWGTAAAGNTISATNFTLEVLN